MADQHVALASRCETWTLRRFDRLTERHVLIVARYTVDTPGNFSGGTKTMLTMNMDLTLNRLCVIGGSDTVTTLTILRAMAHG